MKTISIIVLSLLFSYCYSQNSYYPTLRNYSYLDSTNYWETSNNEEQQKRWANGNIKLEYQTISDSLRLRKEYFESGNLKFTAEVYQKWHIDTTRIEYLIGVDTFYTNSGYVDVMHGEYKEYYDWQQIKIKTTGKFIRGNMVGEWTTKTGEGALITATFNRDGLLDGPYFEYYYKKDEPRALIKWRGQYKNVKYLETSKSLFSGEPTVSEEKRVVQDGLWYHYDHEGNLLETITYEWIKK